MATGHPVVNVSPNNPVFDLPIYVARDEGLFERAGIEVRFQAKYSQRNASDKEAFSRLKESLFEQGKADVYNLCRGGIDRSGRSNAAPRCSRCVRRSGRRRSSASTPRSRSRATSPVSRWESTTGPARTTPAAKSRACSRAAHRRRAPWHRRTAGAEGQEPRRGGDGAFHQPGPEGRRAHRRHVLSRRRGHRARAFERAEGAYLGAIGGRPTASWPTSADTSTT